MARVWILLDLVVYVYMIQSQVIASQSYISSQNVTWREADNNCTLATPKISYTPQGDSVTLEPDLHLENNEKLWIGYTRDYKVFRYIGCVSKEGVTRQESFTIRQDIGQCYSACSAPQYKYFGVKISSILPDVILLKHISLDKKIVYRFLYYPFTNHAFSNGLEITDAASNSAVCTCITDILEQNVIPCGTDSRDQEEFSFGGNSTMALYTLASSALVFTNDSSWNDTRSNCFTYFNPAQKTFKWVNCSIRYTFLCTSSLTGGTDNVGNTSRRWKVAAEACLENKQYLSRYQGNIEINSTAQQWMSHIKAESISSTTGPAFSKHKRFGYIEKDKNGFKLKFNNGDGEFRALCSNDSSPGDTEERSSNVGVYVGVSVAIILMLVASTIAVIIWKRRQRPADTKGKVGNSIGNLAYQHSDTTVDSHLNNTGYTEIDLKETTHGGYETIQDGSAFQNKLPSPNINNNKQYETKINCKMGRSLDAKNDGYSFAKEPGPNKGPETNGSDSYHSLAGDTEGNSQYDRLAEPNGHVAKSTVGQIHDDNEDHVYDKTAIVNTDYDHITRGRIAAGNTVGVNAYDTTSNVKAQRDQQTTRGIDGPANTVEIDDYDTTSNIKAQPDPTYDHAGCVEETAVQDKKSVYSQEQCMFLCRSSNRIKFGLQQRANLECFCFSDTARFSDMTTNIGCDIACRGSELTCGRDGKVALYEEVSNDGTRSLSKCRGWNTTQNNCLALFDSRQISHTERFNWENCSEAFHMNCSRDDDDDDDESKDDDLADPGTEWYKAASICQGAGGFIQPYTSLGTSISTDAIIWTANTRALAIMTSNASDRTPTSQSRGYGYLHKSGDKLFLNFTNDPAQMFRSLCSKVYPGNTTPVTTRRTPTPVTEGDAREDPGDESSSNTNISTVSPLPATDTNSRLIAVFVCVPIAIVLIAAIVVFAVLIRWGFLRPIQCFRKTDTSTPGTINSPSREEDHAFYHEPDNIPERAGTSSNNAHPDGLIARDGGVGDYSYVTQGQIDLTPNDFILEREGNTNGNGHESSQHLPGSSDKEPHNVYDKTNFQANDDSSYDKIGQKSKTVNDSAAYDVAKYGDPMDNPYDTTNVRKVPPSGPDGLYNRLGNDGANDTYNTCSQSTGLQARGNTIYDHTHSTGQ